MILNDLDLECKSGTNQKLVYDFLLVVYSNFCRITHRFWEIWCETVQWPWNMPKVIDSRITWKLSCGHVCKIFRRLNEWSENRHFQLPHSHLTHPAPSPANPREYLHKPYTARNYVSCMGYIFVADSIWVALQVFEQFCPKAGDAIPLVAEPETDFNAKWPFKVIQGHLFWYCWRATKGLHSTI